MRTTVASPPLRISKAGPHSSKWKPRVRPALWQASPSIDRYDMLGVLIDLGLLHLLLDLLDLLGKPQCLSTLLSTDDHDRGIVKFAL